MQLDELLLKVPELWEYIKNMPLETKKHCIIRVIPPGKIIHQKNYELNYFAFVCSGEHRAINEFENGNIYMIEKNSPIDFVGEVTILAGQKQTSVTLETITECILLEIPRKDFEEWISQDINLLMLVAKKVAFKLYRSSSKNGAKLFYPPTYLLLEFIIQYVEQKKTLKKVIMIPYTRERLYEELGMSVKTINRTIRKLKDMNLIGIEKGKIIMSQEQYALARQELTSLLNRKESD